MIKKGIIIILALWVQQIDLFANRNKFPVNKILVQGKLVYNDSVKLDRHLVISFSDSLGNPANSNTEFYLIMYKKIRFFIDARSVDTLHRCNIEIDIKYMKKCRYIFKKNICRRDKNITIILIRNTCLGSAGLTYIRKTKDLYQIYLK